VQEVTVETEVRAAHNVLEACAQTDAMERVVFTSSATAVVWGGDAATVDEKCWSDLAFCRKFKVRPCTCCASHSAANTYFTTRSTVYYLV
jgi:nucleoside-diphosphate-sugar epimerase